jgi:IS605 OrfB family transposase
MPYIKKLMSIQKNKQLPEKRRKGMFKKVMLKIQRYVDDAQWKIINDLVKNYGTIMIGELSTQSIVNKTTSKMTAEMKELSYKLKFYEFRQRLKYKCAVNGVKYKLIDEWGTSKMCTNCTHYDDNLGKKRTYNCSNCNINIDRDIVGGRNITMKGML